MSLVSEALTSYFTPGRLTASLMLDDAEIGIRVSPEWKVDGETATVELLFRFERYASFNAVGWFAGSRLVDRDVLGAKPRTLVPGDEWTYGFTLRAGEV
jgi:hypothetical protein